MNIIQTIAAVAVGMAVFTQVWSLLAWSGFHFAEIDRKVKDWPNQITKPQARLSLGLAAVGMILGVYLGCKVGMIFYAGWSV